MPTIVDILRRDPEPIPAWLDTDGPPRFDRAAFFASRTVYYPGSGDDGQPVKLCALSRAAHTFIYVDYGVDRSTLLKRLRHPEQGFRGYKMAPGSGEDLSEEVLRPGGWTPHVSAAEAKDAGRFRGGIVEPFGWFVVLERQSGDENHGPRRLAILFIGGDGIAGYDALYCQGDGTPPPFLAVIQDCGFGGNYDRFGRDGLLDRIARKSRVRPKFLLVADHSTPWRGYADTGAHAEPGGMHGHPRRLFRGVRRGRPPQGR